MAELDIRPKMLEDLGNVLATANSAYTDATFKVPAGKRWLVDVIELICDTAHASADCDIQVDIDDAGSPENIWPQVDNFLNLTVDLASRYPRAVELEAADYLEVKFTNATGGNITWGVRAFVIERDV